MLMMASCATRDGLKGRPPPRSCPDDFDVIFVEQGREACEPWYRASKKTVSRWLEERGKVRLIDARATFVSHQRAGGRWITRQTRMVEHKDVRPAPTTGPIRDKRKVSFIVARHAAQHLRIVRNGGFIVSQAPNGDWRVGTRRLSSAQLVDFAKEKGFLILTEEAAHSDEDIVKLTVGGRQGRDTDRAKWMAEWSDRMRAQRGAADLGLGANWQADDD